MVVSLSPQKLVAHNFSEIINRIGIFAIRPSFWQFTAADLNTTDDKACLVI